MKRFKQIIFILIIGVFSLEAIFSNIVFAQTNTDTTSEEGSKCVVCGMPSLEFQTYVNFQVNVLQILQNAVKEPEWVGNNRKVWLFSAGILGLPSRLWESWKKMFKKSAEDLTQSSRAVKIWSIMLGTITTEIVGKDSVGWLKILTRNAPFVRDWKTLQELDMSMHDIMRDFGMKWLWDEKLSDDIRDGLLNLQQKYVANSGNEKALFEQFTFAWDVKYKDLVNMSLKLNSVMKSFISNRSKLLSFELFESDLFRFNKEMRTNNVRVRFNILFMSDMFYNYKCAEWLNACNDAWDSFKESIKAIPMIKEWFTESKKIITKANIEFAEAFASLKTDVKDVFDDKSAKELGLTEKQITLLRTVYGIDTSKLTKQQWVWLSTLLNWSAWKNIANSIHIQPLDIFSAESIAAKKKVQKLKKQNMQDQKYLDSITDAETKKAEAQALSDLKTNDVWELQNALLSSIDSVMAEKSEDKQVVMFYNNLTSTRYFKEIWSLIHSWIDNVIWTKDSDGLIKYLWNACELQCTNKWNKHCYAK